MSMKYSRKILLIICAVMVLMCSAGLVYATGTEPAEYGTLDDSYVGKTVLLQTNDVHGAVDGYQYVAGLRDELVRRGADVYLVDVGDFMQGDIYVAWDNGCSAIELMNAAKYDLATVGNHEFDYTFVEFKSNLKAAKFDLICDNMIEDASQEPVFPGTKMIAIGDLKIGFFAVDTPSTKTESAPKNTEGLTFLDKDTVPTIYKKAGEDVIALRKSGADIIIGMTHLGVNTSSTPYRSYDLWDQLNKMSLDDGEEYIPGTPVVQPDPEKNMVPDFILDGHSHTVMSAGENGEPIMQTGTKLANVGLVIIDEKTEKIEKNFLYKVEDIQTAGWSNAEVAATSKQIKDYVDDLYSQKVFESKVELNGTKDKADAEQQGKPFPNGNRDGETNLGDLSADAFTGLALSMIQSGDIKDITADHVVGFVNGGGIRAGIEAGGVTKKDVMSVFPWNNTVFGIYIKGSGLLEVLEASTFAMPETEGGFPQISGLDYTIDTRYKYWPRKDPYPGSTYYGPEKIRRVTINDVNGKPFSKDDTYLVMTNSFCGTGGNACYLFGQTGKRFDTGMTDTDALVSYVVDSLSGVVGEEYSEPTGSGRITVLTGPEKKSTNPMTVKVTNKTVKYKKAKKSAQKVKPFKVSKAAGKVTYKKTSGSARLTFNKKTGAVTVKKGTKKGTYKITVKFTASGDDYYNSKIKTVTAKIRVK